MERKLLLLGILRDHDMHGYQINTILADDVGIGMTLKKASAYKLLGQMADDGWVTYREEREGNRPPRRVYAIAPEGEAAFQQMLSESLGSYKTPQMPSLIAYNHIHALPADAAVALLDKRRQTVEQRFQQLEAVPKEMVQAHPSMVYLHRFYAAELAWLDEMVEGLMDQLGDDN